MDRLVCVETFVKVVEGGHFVAAARALGVSPGQVTGRIKSLENRLGVRLLNRTTRRISLTEAGRALYPRYAQTLAELAEAEGSAQALESAPRGTLRLNTSTPMLLLVAPVIREFSTRYPAAAVDLTMTDQAVDFLQEGFDLAIREASATNMSFISRRIATYRLVVCASPDYLARRGVPREPADLAQHDCLCRSGPVRVTEWEFDGPWGRTKIAVSGNLKGNSEYALRIAAVQGQGLLMTPSFLVADELESRRLVAVLGEFLTAEHAINAVYPHRQHLPAKVRCFIDLVVSHFRTALAPRIEPKSEGSACAPPSPLPPTSGGGDISPCSG